MVDSGRVRLLPDVIEIEKDQKGHIGVAIGGGAPFCPCLYVVQVFDNGSVAVDGRIHAGDELVAVNGQSCKDMEKSAVAKLIKQMPGPLKLSVNRIQFDDDAGQTLDITLKRLKHWWVERMDAKTADAFGLSRAILCNDMLAQLLKRLEANQLLYSNLARIASNMSRQHSQLADAMNTMATMYAEVATRESQDSVNCKFFANVATLHRAFVKETPSLVAKIDAIGNTFQMFTEKAIPDTKDTVKKYLDKKFEYLSFCLKIKEMDDEEAQMVEYNDYLPRIDNGNYEYRVMLRSREKSRETFIEMRKQVMVKIEILDEKHVRELGLHLRALVSALGAFHKSCSELLKDFVANNEDGLKNESDEIEQNLNKVEISCMDDDAKPLICTENW